MPTASTSRATTGNKSRQSIQRKIIQRRNREQLKKQINLLKEKLKSSEKKAEKYKKKVQRLRNKQCDTPTKKVNNMLQGQRVTPQVHRKLMFSEIIQRQLKTNFKKTAAGAIKEILSIMWLEQK